MSTRRDGKPPKLGLFLGNFYLRMFIGWPAGIRDDFGLWLEAVWNLRSNAIQVSVDKRVKQRLRKDVSKLSERLHYIQMDMKDLEKYSSPNIPSSYPSEALEVVSTEMPGVQCIDFAVRSFRHHHLVPVMDLTLALNGNRWLAEGIAVKMARVFEAWCYGEMCRELKVPLERAKETTNRNLLEGL